MQTRATPFLTVSAPSRTPCGPPASTWISTPSTRVWSARSTLNVKRSLSAQAAESGCDATRASARASTRVLNRRSEHRRDDDGPAINQSTLSRSAAGRTTCEGPHPRQRRSRGGGASRRGRAARRDVRHREGLTEAHEDGGGRAGARRPSERKPHVDAEDDAIELREQDACAAAQRLPQVERIPAIERVAGVVEERAGELHGPQELHRPRPVLRVHRQEVGAGHEVAGEAAEP